MLPWVLGSTQGRPVSSLRHPLACKKDLYMALPEATVDRFLLPMLRRTAVLMLMQRGPCDANRMNLAN